MKYFMLTSNMNSNQIIKEHNNQKFRYLYGISYWEECKETDFKEFESGEYIELPEEKAKNIINQQQVILDKMLSVAIQLATKAHDKQTDKGGVPYILHPIHVSNEVNDTESKIVAYLHDVCEDTSITLFDLVRIGFTNRIINAIRTLTKSRFISYEEYIKDINKDYIAKKVKIADLKHNMDISRIPNPTEKDYLRIQKYKKSLDYLLNN